MAKSKDKAAKGSLEKGVTFCEEASQKGTETHSKGGSQSAKKGSDRV